MAEADGGFEGFIRRGPSEHDVARSGLLAGAVRTDGENAFVNLGLFKLTSEEDCSENELAICYCEVCRSMDMPLENAEWSSAVEVKE